MPILLKAQLPFTLPCFSGFGAAATPMVFWNTLGWCRSEIVELPQGESAGCCRDVDDPEPTMGFIELRQVAGHPIACAA